MTGERGLLFSGTGWAALPIVHAKCADDAAIAATLSSEHTTATGADGFVGVAFETNLAHSRWLQPFHDREYIPELHKLLHEIERFAALPS